VQLDHRVLGHGLREGIDVGEAHGARVDPPSLHQPVLHPPLPQPLNRASLGRRAGRAHLAARLASELVQDLRPPALLLHRRAQRAQDLGLVAPVEPRVAGQLLAEEPAQHPSHVGGRDVDQVRTGLELPEEPHQAGGAQEVGLCREVRRVVELHRGGGVDDDVAAPKLLAPGRAHPKAVEPEVDLQHGELLRSQPPEGVLAQFILQPAEGGAGQHLALQAFGCGPSGAGADGEIDPTDLGQGSEQLLDDGLAQEAGGAGDEQRSTGDGFFDQLDDCRGPPRPR